MTDVINFPQRRPNGHNLLELFENIQALQYSNPKALDAFIKKQIQEKIEELSKDKSEEYKKSLEQFQWSILKELRKYKDPVSRMNKMAELFWTGVEKFEQGLRRT